MTMEQIENPSHYIWKYFTVSNSSEAKKDGAKNAVCKFCDKIFSGCCTRATAHILGRPVECIGPNKCCNTNMYSNQQKNDDRRAILKNAK